MFRFEFVTDVPFELRQEILSAILSEISALPKIPTQLGVLNVAFVDDAAMRGYNRDYRGIDSTTDVLSFHYFDDFSECPDDGIAGEILLSETRIRAQAPEYGNTAETETYKLLIHSVLHVLGYDHEEDSEYAEMKKREDAVSKKLTERFGTRIG